MQRYVRVIPRDLFNEANLLKCLGALYIALEIPGWRRVITSAPELEPAFRRVADGLASRLDVARVDRLRLLGNGVVSLAGAYAFRTLAARLAARGAAVADRLVRMMEEQP